MVKVGGTLHPWSGQTGVEFAAIAVVSCQPLRYSAEHAENRLLADSSFLV